MCPLTLQPIHDSVQNANMPSGSVLNYIVLWSNVQFPSTRNSIHMVIDKSTWLPINTPACVQVDSSAAVPTHDSHGVSHCSVCSPLHTDCLSLDGSRSYSDLPNVGWNSRKNWKRWPSWPSRALPALLAHLMIPVSQPTQQDCPTTTQLMAVRR